MIFVWRSELLQAYGEGWIVVEAGSPGMARLVAKRKFERWLEEYMKDYGMGDDELDAETRGSKLSLFERDIAKEPERHAALFIKGSE